ncbi:MAG: permease [Clostridiales bacterium]|nr:permease [Clostridiales bacterium]
MQNIIMYSLAVILLALSFFKDKTKTKQSLKKAWKSFENIFPQMLGMITFIGLALAILSPETISKIIGGASGWFGVVLGAVVGSVTLIPAFVAFPMAAILLENGAGKMQLAAFLSTLTMVGVLTMPMEIKFFGKKFAFLRNILAFVFSFLTAFIIGKVVG